MKISGRSEHFEHVRHSQMSHIRFFISDITYCPPHFHYDIEIIQVIEGKILIGTSRETATLQAGEIAMFNSNEFHSIESVDENSVILAIQIDPDFCIQHYPAIKFMHFQTANITSAVPFETCLEMIPVCYNLGYNYYSKIKGYELRCMSDLFKLFWYIVTYVPYVTFTDAELQSQKKQQKRLCNIIEYIRKHYTEKITLSQIAERENLSLTYLSHLFSDTMNMSFQQYLNMLRLERAMFLLNNTNMNLLEICMESGFSDPKYLNKQFLLKFHISPKDYRKQSKHKFQDSVDFSDENIKIQYIYSPMEGLKILRKHHHFNCDFHRP